ncbi:hypothetical protein P3X46_005225 [Hevea brasiliensis]|uniref:Uncharacterized protein n=2 Tax=Hevea brasiliensis TaxID=3981 RepID=A0ABQ9N1Y6_HEVBR|nr:hypothetical protein P3X46_005225 [Hevea brasiliensis]
MASSLPNPFLLLPFSLLLLLPSCLGNSTVAITHHGGPILTGNLNLTFIWYGQFGRVQKNALRAFVDSLNYNAAANLQPQVSQWWKIVEGFQDAAGKPNAPIIVKVVKQITDVDYSVGKVFTRDSVKPLIQKASSDDKDAIPVIFTAKDVSVDGLCKGKCSEHGVLENKPYLLVGNPENECPGACAWPFHKSDSGPVGVTLNPPNGNVGADAMAIAFAEGLVDIVTNPLNTGFFQENNESPIEAGSACHGVFGSGALAGYTGKVRIDPSTGGGFNAHGSRGKKFLLPAIWDPKTHACWTLM